MLSSAAEFQIYTGFYEQITFLLADDVPDAQLLVLLQKVGEHFSGSSIDVAMRRENEDALQVFGDHPKFVPCLFREDFVHTS